MTDSATSSQLSLTDPFVRSLACAAITPGLQSILLFDSSLEVLRMAAQTTAEMLKEVTGHSIIKVTLTTFEAEDELWGSLGLSGDSHEHPLQWKPGLLVGENQTKQNRPQFRLVVIPDLTKLSIAAARACVIMMGADVVHLERHGQQQHWRPNLFWFAGCASNEVGMVSPHLLDRFALRLSKRATKSETINQRVEEIRKWILSTDEQSLENKNQPEPNLPIEIRENLKKAFQHHPTITPEAIARILDYTPKMSTPRREIALARLSLAHTRLTGAAEMSADDVNAAAEMIGLEAVKKTIKELPPETSQPVTPTKTPEVKTEEVKDLIDKSQSNTETKSVPVYESDKTEYLESTSLTVTYPPKPYPEDTAPVERELASLRLPTRSFRSKTANHGLIIGVEKATTFQDIALVRTLLEAAKFQPIRRRRVKNLTANRLILSPTDLYSYRRAPVAEQMLTLVLDHTCLQNCKWQEELLPYLNWAYVERASMCLIQVGAKNTRNDLQAERVMARSILMPRINAGLEAERGKATPLAHGLDLALKTLRHTLQHGRSTVREAMLVVLTDGRGNVPLEASHCGHTLAPVGRKGIEDALEVAQRIHGLDGVKAVLLNPQSREYPELPLELAQALGAKVVLIPLQETWELE
ncbi:MAG: hypothetical protein V7L11_02155 [Nostoc sp.]|uniref:hypothetical protein n=1 Tax=Nostoc sp. TaxID=1180 RepID=UPI002FF78BD4